MKMINKTRLRYEAQTPSIGLWKRFVALLIMTICMIHVSYAQIVEGVDEFFGFMDKGTIVRTINEESSLIYLDNGLNKQFILYEHATNQAHRAPLMPDAIIKDFEVYNGWAYFCGQIDLGWTVVGLVGQFNIMDVFYQGAPIYYLPMSFWPAPWVVVITDATRMTVYDDGTAVYIFAVGLGEHGYPSPSLYNASTLFSATMNLSAQEWNFCINYNKDQKLNYVDIDCTENYVGFTAVDSVDSVYIGISTHPDFCFFYAGAPDIYAIGTKAEKEKVLITGMKNDRFTVAYQPKTSRWIEFVQVPLPITNPFKVTDTDSSQNAPVCTTWTLRDLKYSDYTDKVLLVGDMYFLPCDRMDSWVVGYDWTGAINSRIPFQLGNPHSVDKHTNSSRFISTGESPNGDLMFAVDDILIPVTEDCFEACQVTAEWNDRTHKWDYANTDESKQLNELSLKYYPNVTQIEVLEMCR